MKSRTASFFGQKSTNMATEPYDTDNIFAKILRGEIPSYKIFETEYAYAFLDAFPVSRGHCLLIPKALGFRTIMDMDPETASSLLRELPRLAKAVQAATGCSGVNILQNNDASAGQIVFHAHFHVIPRYPDDSLFVAPPSAKEMISGDAAGEVLKAIQDK